MCKVLFSPISDIRGFEAIFDYLDDGIEVEYSENVPERADYQILVSASPTQNHLTASPNLRSMIFPSLGPSLNVIRQVRVLPYVSLYQLPYNAPAVVETALALLLSVAKFIPRVDAALRKGDWSHRYKDQPQFLLSGHTALVLGYGRVGRTLSAVLEALNMRIVAIRRHVEQGDDDHASVNVHGSGELAALLPKADVIINTLPVLPETDSWIGASEFGLMPASAIVVNVGNPNTIDEASLFAALKNKHIAGAGLDVWYGCPSNLEERINKRPSRFPFSVLDNVVMSPHQAGQLGIEDGGRVEMLADMINKAYRGDDVPHRVHLGLGY